MAQAIKHVALHGKEEVNYSSDPRREHEGRLDQCRMQHCCCCHAVMRSYHQVDVVMQSVCVCVCHI